MDFLLELRDGPPAGSLPNGIPIDYCAQKGAGLIAPGTPIPDQGRRSAIAIWTLLGFAGVFLILRIYAKAWRLRRLWWDDWVLIFSFLCFIVDASMSQVAINLGLGKYPCDVDPRNFRQLAIQGEGVGATFGMFAVVWSKTSFAITLLRLTDGKLHRFVWFAIGSMNFFVLLEALFVWVDCNPVSKNWDPQTPGTCWPTDAVNGYGVFAACTSGFYDVVLALLPWRLVWNLKMQKKEKFGVAIAMSLGIVAGATGFVKSAKILTLGSTNFTYDGCELLVWAAGEISTTIMASCIPVLRVFFREVGGRSIAGGSKSAAYKKHLGNDSGMSGSRQRHAAEDKQARAVDSPTPVGRVPAAAATPTAMAPWNQPKQPSSAVNVTPLRTGAAKVVGDDDSGSEKSVVNSGTAQAMHYEGESISMESLNPSGHGRSQSNNRGGRIIRTQKYAVEYGDDERSRGGANGRGGFI